MEDNEFEEVTIISHTDHGTSVLPQSFARVRPKLDANNFLKVTQKITSEAVKTFGSLKDRLDPRGLELAQAIQKTLPDPSSQEDYGFIGEHPEDSSRILIGSKDSSFLVQPPDTVSRSLTEAPLAAMNVWCYGPVRYILPWHQFLVVFREKSRVHVVKDGQRLTLSERYFSFCRQTQGRVIRPWFDEEHIVFLAESKFLVKFSRELEVHDAEYGGISDIGVETSCKDVTLLFGPGSITTESRESQSKPRFTLEQHLSNSCFGPMRCISNKSLILVREKGLVTHNSVLHLLRSPTKVPSDSDLKFLAPLSTLALPDKRPTADFIMRLCRPQLDFQPLLCALDNILYVVLIVKPSSSEPKSQEVKSAPEGRPTSAVVSPNLRRDITRTPSNKTCRPPGMRKEAALGSSGRKRTHDSQGAQQPLDGKHPSDRGQDATHWRLQHGGSLRFEGFGLGLSHSRVLGRWVWTGVRQELLLIKLTFW